MVAILVAAPVYQRMTCSYVQYNKIILLGMETKLDQLSLMGIGTGWYKICVTGPFLSSEIREIG